MMLDARRERMLTASRIAPLMTGDAEKILRLYKEISGETEPEDLSHVWAVQLGLATEPLNLDWYELKQSVPLMRRGEFVVHPKYEWLGCTLDAWDEQLGCPIEAKHCGGREPIEIIVDRYQPQMQAQMEITGADQCGLSIIQGANEPVVEFIDRDPEYAMELVRRGEQFMACVRNRVPPVELPEAPPPANGAVIYDMSKNNVWCSESFVWLENLAAARRHIEAAQVLKSLVPDDARKCHGAGVQISRDRARRLAIREMKQ